MLVLLPLFVYGTLRDSQLFTVLTAVVPAYEAATLVGYCAGPLAGRAYPGLVVRAGANTAGWLVTAPLSATAWAALDDYEGEEYERIAVEIHRQRPGAAAGETISAQVYALRPEYHALLLDC